LSTTKIGNIKKNAIIESVIQIIGEKGISSVTHREVAKRTGVSLSSTTYYFKSREEMIESAYTELIQNSVDRHNDLIERLKTRKASLEEITAMYLTDMLGIKSQERIKIIAILELQLESARSGKYRKLLRKFRETNQSLLRMMLKKEYRDSNAVREVSMLLGGLVTEQLSTPWKNFKNDILNIVVKKYFDFTNLKI